MFCPGHRSDGSSSSRKSLIFIKKNSEIYSVLIVQNRSQKIKTNLSKDNLQYLMKVHLKVQCNLSNSSDTNVNGSAKLEVFWITAEDK